MNHFWLEKKRKMDNPQPSPSLFLLSFFLSFIVDLIVENDQILMIDWLINKDESAGCSSEAKCRWGNACFYSILSFLIDWWSLKPLSWSIYLSMKEGINERNKHFLKIWSNPLRKRKVIIVELNWINSLRRRRRKGMAVLSWWFALSGQFR